MRHRSTLHLCALATALVVAVSASCKPKLTPVEKPETLVTEGVEMPGLQADKLDFLSYYSIDPLEVRLEVPSYSLPLAGSDIKNLGDVESKMPIDAAARAQLLDNGFVVFDNPLAPTKEVFVPVYDTLEDREIPIFITTDSLLHLYHIQFDETLRRVEENQFYQMIWEISQALIERSLQVYESADGEVKEAARRNVAYLSVALELLDPEPDQICSPEMWQCQDPGLRDTFFSTKTFAPLAFDAPAIVAEDVASEIAYIEAHAGFTPSPVFKYSEDYSQYVPRGHYTRSEKLKNYFKAMMWFGRVTMLIKKGLVSEKDARIQTMQAALLADGFDADGSLMDRWERIYGVTAFYVGLSDDLGPYEYVETIDEVFGGSFAPAQLDAATVDAMKVELAEYGAPKIYGGTGGCAISPPFSPAQAEQCLAETKGFRLMGQRFIPDSYLFTNLVSPYAGTFTGDSCFDTFTCVMTDDGPWRGFPRGLDVMVLLGSQRAEDVLISTGDATYSGYPSAMAKMRDEFAQFDGDDWHQNLYWSWLHALEPLVQEFPEGTQPFMRTTAWQDKELVTALASWAELRHDTILYAKQSYTVMTTSVKPPPVEKPVVGYIEPVPEFYNRLLALTRMSTRGLDDMGVLDHVSKSRLEVLEQILARLVELSVKELENEELTADDYDFIKHFGDALSGVIADVEYKAKRTAMVADVHTDTNSGQVLEEAVGHVRLMLVAYVLPDGRILVGAGPVFSYYEFLHPMSDRLTDEKWRQLLGATPPPRPEWNTSDVN